MMRNCESAQCYSTGLEDNCARLCFIRRVFMLLIMALSVMLCQVILIQLIEPLRTNFATHFWIAFIALSIFLLISLLLACTPRARSCFPWNFLLYLILIESLTLILMVCGAIFGTEIMILTISGEICILLILLVMALIVPVDFTRWTAFIFVLFVAVFVFALMTVISDYTAKYSPQVIAFSFLAACLLSMLMLMNFQVLFNGYIFELYPEDWILGGILMFADVVIIFMCALKLIGFDTDDCID